MKTKKLISIITVLCISLISFTGCDSGNQINITKEDAKINNSTSSTFEEVKADVDNKFKELGIADNDAIAGYETEVSEDGVSGYGSYEITIYLKEKVVDKLRNYDTDEKVQQYWDSFTYSCTNMASVWGKYLCDNDFYYTVTINVRDAETTGFLFDVSADRATPSVSDYVADGWFNEEYPKQ